MASFAPKPVPWQGGYLQDEKAQPQATKNACAVAVLGGGLAGLCAAHRLVQRGVTDVMILEAEGDTGGNARSGGEHPWGAGYVPVPSRRSALYEFALLLKDLGVSRKDICRAPLERLYLRARKKWQRVDPEHGVAPVEVVDKEE